MKIFLATIIGVVLGIATNLLSDIIAPAMAGRTKLIVSCFVGLIALSILVSFIPDAPPKHYIPSDTDSAGQELPRQKNDAGQAVRSGTDDSTELLRQDLARIKQDLAEQKEINKSILILLEGFRKTQAFAEVINAKQLEAKNELSDLRQIAEKQKTEPSGTATQERLLTLKARASDLDLQAQFLNQSRMSLANQVSSLFSTASNLPEGSERDEVEKRINAIQQIDKTLELQSRRISTQQDAVQTDLDAVERIIGQNIEANFKTLG